MDRERFEKQLNFILEIDKEKQILRQTHIRGYSRQEDDAEHAWHMAVMAFLLQEYSNEKIDIGRTMLMLLIHDLVEIDAGDTYAYDAEANKTKDEREHKAAERIYGLLPEDQGKMLMDLWLEFEARKTGGSHQGKRTGKNTRTAGRKEVRRTEAEGTGCGGAEKLVS